ncbi:MAG TPA: DUF5615 family PIN-like protein [Candidatus Desulfobacillus sp.]|nr:DUF5615 family PIN-like protein [Candidatus Desulfobacillus sp.]
MKLLLDENLSRRIVALLQEAWPDTTQVALVGLEKASDRDLWEFAKNNGYAIVSKDEDFIDLQADLGYPPKVIHLAMGNCGNEQVAEALNRHRLDIESALARDDTGYIKLV